MTQKPSRLSVLAEIISEQVAIIDQYLMDNHIPEPTFAQDQAGLDSTFQPAIENARNLLREATLELHELTMGPRSYMQNLIFKDSSCFIDIIYRFRIAQRVPLHKPEGISYADLSSQVGIDRSALQHILRFAIANRIFTEPTPDSIAHNANSAAIVNSPDLFDWMGLASQDILPMLQRLGATLERFPSADEPTEAAGSTTDDADDPSSARIAFYHQLARSPERARRFAGGMAFHSKSEAYGMHHMLSGFAWDSLPRGATVVDLGGSHGEAARAVTSRHPHLRFVVQDLPDTIASATPMPLPVVLDGEDDDEGGGRGGESGGISLMAHDFFLPQPVVGADVYYFRWILHNWPDKYCVRILRALVPALRAGARVLVIDDVLPPFGSRGAFCERRLRMLDAVMMALGNAREREEGEFLALFAEADARFRYVGMTVPEGSQMAVMEMVWEP